MPNIDRKLVQLQRSLGDRRTDRLSDLIRESLFECVANVTVTAKEKIADLWFTGVFW